MGYSRSGLLLVGTGEILQRAAALLFWKEEIFKSPILPSLTLIQISVLLCRFTQSPTDVVDLPLSKLPCEAGLKLQEPAVFMPIPVAEDACERCLDVFWQVKGT